MGAEDIVQIRIGNFPIGIVGLKAIMAELAEGLAEASDDEMAEKLLQKVAQRNYIPPKAREEYGRALVREFKKFLGRQDAAPEEPQGLVIKVLGQGCANCQALSRLVMEVLEERKLAADFEHVTDLKAIAGYGAALTPALWINGKIVAVGRVPTKAQVSDWIQQAAG